MSQILEFREAKGLPAQTPSSDWLSWSPDLPTGKSLVARGTPIQELRLSIVMPVHLDGAEQVFQREKASFMRWREDLLGDPSYLNKFIAVVGGKVVDSDLDENVLAQRVYEKHGYIPIYIGKIELEEKVLEVPSPELL